MGKPSKHVLHTKIYQSETKEYRNYLLLLGYNKVTCQSRYLMLKEFFAWIEGIGIYKLEQITPQEIAGFYEYLQSRKSIHTGNTLKQGSIYDIMRNVQSYLGYALQEEKIKSSPASHLKFNQVKTEVARKILSQDEIKQLYRAIETNQEKALLHIAYGCGLRVNEIAALNKEDIRTNENLVIVVKGKFSKRRVIPINDKVNNDLQEFIETQNTGKAMFYNSKATRMQEWTINKLLKRIIKRTDFGSQLTRQELNKIGVHTLRHSIATHLLENGMKLEQVQTFLGHAHLQSTETYTHVSQKQLSALQR